MNYFHTHGYSYCASIVKYFNALCSCRWHQTFWNVHWTSGSQFKAYVLPGLLRTEWYKTRMPLMNKTLVTDTMCIIHTFHFTGKAVTAFTAWSHTTSDRDRITSENTSTSRRCGLWMGNAEMKPKVLPRALLVFPDLALLPLRQQQIWAAACSWGHRAALPGDPNHMSTIISAQKRCHSASGCLARIQFKQPYPAYLYFSSTFNCIL